jgi:hypothetical protein
VVGLTAACCGEKSYVNAFHITKMGIAARDTRENVNRINIFLEKRFVSCDKIVFFAQNELNNTLPCRHPRGIGATRNLWLKAGRGCNATQM